MGCENTKMRPEEPASESAEKKPEEPASENAEKKPEEPASENAEKKPEEPASENAEKKPEKPASESQSAEAEKTTEVPETQPTHEPPSDASQMTTQVEDHTQQNTQIYFFEDTKKQPAQVYCVEDSVQKPGSEIRSSKVVCTASGEGKITPELIELIEEIVGINVPSTQTIVFESHLGEGSRDTSTVKHDSTLTAKREPRVSKEQSEALPPDAPVAEVTGAQTTGRATQQESPEGVRISHAATQTVSAPKGAEVNAGLTEEKEGESRKLKRREPTELLRDKTTSK